MIPAFILISAALSQGLMTRLTPTPVPVAQMLPSASAPTAIVVTQMLPTAPAEEILTAVVVAQRLPDSATVPTMTETNEVICMQPATKVLQVESTTPTVTDNADDGFDDDGGTQTTLTSSPIMTISAFPLSYPSVTFSGTTTSYAAFLATPFPKLFVSQGLTAWSNAWPLSIISVILSVV